MQWAYQRLWLLYRHCYSSSGTVKVAELPTIPTLVHVHSSKCTQTLSLCVSFTVGTISGLRAELKCATETLIKARTSTVSVSSGCELFLRFITMTSLEGETVRGDKACVCACVCVKEGGREKVRTAGERGRKDRVEHLMIACSFCPGL